MGGGADASANALDSLWKTITRGEKRGLLQACITPPAEEQAGAKSETGLLPKRAYPILFAREPQPWLRLVCLRDPWLEETPVPSTLRAWAPDAIEWTRHRQIAEMLLPISEAVGG
jgi:hypothetical protein